MGEDDAGAGQSTVFVSLTYWCWWERTLRLGGYGRTESSGVCLAEREQLVDSAVWERRLGVVGVRGSLLAMIG